jgi:large subunit ribosomal protein L21
MTYAIISLGGKQYRVQEGQRLVVDRLAHDDGKTFHPDVLFVGGDGKAEFAPRGTQVTAKVLGGTLGEKIRIGKYKKRTGYKRHNGHRSRLTRIEIESIGGKAAKAAVKPKAEKAEPEAEKADVKAETAAPGIDIASMTIADIKTAAVGWSNAEVEAALAAEQAGKARKGAITALESALEEKS